MLVDNERDHRKYAGMAPAFVQRVWNKRRQEDADRLLREASERKHREREERERLAREERERRDAERRLKKLGVDEAVSGYSTINVMNVRPNARAIVSEVAGNNGLSFSEVVGARRDRHVVAVRDAAIRAVADARPDMSLPAISRIFHRDHTTIMHSLRKTKKPGQAR